MSSLNSDLSELMRDYGPTDAAEADLCGIISHISICQSEAQVRLYIADLSRFDLDAVGCSSLQRHHIG